MELSKREKERITGKTAPRYRRAGRKEKGRILEEYIALTGYNRAYARWLLRMWGKVQVLRFGGEERRYVVGRGRQSKKPSRSRRYDETVVEVLKAVWLFSGELCGKRLEVVVYDFAVSLQRAGKLQADSETLEKLRGISGVPIHRGSTDS